MKLIRRGASSRRKTSERLGGAISPTRWRATKGVTSCSPRVVPATGTCARESLLDYFRSRRGCTVTLGTTATFLVVVVIVLLLALKTSSATLADTSTFADPPSELSTTESNSTLPEGIHLVSKQQWDDRPSRHHPRNTPPYTLLQPSPFVVISATKTTACSNFYDCSRICRRIQDDLEDGRNMNDISTFFLEGGDWSVYEGLGWDKTNGFNLLLTRRNVDLCYIRDFSTDVPTDRPLIAARELLTSGVHLGKLDADYKLFALNDTAAFEAPGENLYTRIKHWRHFTRPNTV